MTKGGLFSLIIIITTPMIIIRANRKLDSGPRNIGRQPSIVKKQEKSRATVKIKVAVYQVFDLSGIRYSGTCHLMYFESFLAIYLIDKACYILYSNYNIKIKKRRNCCLNK